MKLRNFGILCTLVLSVGHGFLKFGIFIRAAFLVIHDNFVSCNHLATRNSLRETTYQLVIPASYHTIVACNLNDEACNFTSNAPPALATLGVSPSLK